MAEMPVKGGGLALLLSRDIRLTVQLIRICELIMIKEV